MATINATRNANGTYTTNADNKVAQVAAVAGKTAVVAAAATAYVAASALATYGWSKLGEKIWDAL